MGVAIRPRNLPGIPQLENRDFFKLSLMTLAISIGDVDMQSKGVIPSIGSK